MTWKDSKSANEVIDATEWTNFADRVQLLSGSYHNHSGNKDIHFASSNLEAWLDNVYAQSGVTSGYWTSTQASGISYNSPVRVGDTGFYTDGYNFQVSGDTLLSGGVTFIGELSGLADPTYNSGAANKHYVDITAHPSANGNFPYISSQTISGGTINTAEINTTRIDSTIISANNVYVADRLYHKEDVNTYINFESDNIAFWAGGDNLLEITGAGNKVTINGPGANIDFVVEGDDKPNLFYLDAGNDRIGIGNDNPKYLFDVSGALHATSISSSTISGGSAKLGELTFLDGNEASGMVLQSTDSDGTVAWHMPAMTFNVVNMSLSSGQNINVTRFTCPASKKCYIWQAAACNSGGVSIGDLYIELLSGSTSIYKTSSAEIQEGNPLGVSSGGKTEIRFMYSGASASGNQIGTGFMNISVY